MTVNERPGVKFADLELIGIPHRIVVSDCNSVEGKYEYVNRRETEKQMLSREEVMAKVSGK